MKRSIIFIMFFLMAVCLGNTRVRAMDVQDDFDAPTLNESWSWSSHPNVQYSLTENQGFLTINIPGDRPYDLWSNDLHDGPLMLRYDQGHKDWIIETRIHVLSKAEAFQTGLVVWSNSYVMYYWTINRDPGRKNLRLLGESYGISNLKKLKRSLEVEEQAVLRVEKLGKNLHLQYWDEEAEAFVTYDTYTFKFPVEGVGIMARTTSRGVGDGLKVMVDYFKLIK